MSADKSPTSSLNITITKEDNVNDGGPMTALEEWIQDHDPRQLNWKFIWSQRHTISEETNDEIDDDKEEDVDDELITSS